MPRIASPPRLFLQGRRESNPELKHMKNSLTYDEILSALSALQTLSQRRNITIRTQALLHPESVRWSSLYIR